MLSRIAESLYWIGRYVERAEDTTRIADVHLQLMLDDPSADHVAAGRRLLDMMGAPHSGAPDTAEVSEWLVYDESSPCSVTAALDNAREAARRARETVSPTMWEAINTTWHGARGGQLRRLQTATAFKRVQDRCQVITGIAHSTMSRDEAWLFLSLGRNLERVDMTARLISTAAISGHGAGAWNRLLRGCGALHAFTRQYGGASTETDAAEFLLLDRLFPRSIVHSLAASSRALEALDPGDRRAGVGGRAERLLGTARAELEFRPPEELLSDLTTRMEELQMTCNDASNAIASRFFSGAEAALWHGGAL